MQPSSERKVRILNGEYWLLKMELLEISLLQNTFSKKLWKITESYFEP